MMDQPLILGSASPRRRKLLAEMGVPFEVVIPDVEEAHDEESPEALVRESALRKHAWCRKRVPDRQILTADTIVVLDGRSLTKPESLDQAREFFRQMSGKEHEVLTAVVLSQPGAEPRIEVVRSEVRFNELDEDAINAYFDKVDPMDKAGAYDIDEQGEMIIESFTGSRSNIMGLPMELVVKLLGSCRKSNN